MVDLAHEKVLPFLALLALGNVRKGANEACAWRRKKPQPPKPVVWTIYKLAAKAERLGTVEAPDEATAIERGAVEFKVVANRLMAIRR
jgi:hypothetical protein